MYGPMGMGMEMRMARVIWGELVGITSCQGIRGSTPQTLVAVLVSYRGNQSLKVAFWNDQVWCFTFFKFRSA